MKQNKWQMKAWAEKAHEGYSDAVYEDVWSLDERLADIISKHLHAFLKAERPQRRMSTHHCKSGWGRKGTRVMVADDS